MMKTINFCGDSFCMNESEKSWCVILAKKLNAKIVGFGKGGTAHEHAIKSFNPKADINIFCWTEYNRVYHKKYLLNFNNVDKNINQKNKVYAAAKVYYKYLHDYTYAKEYYDFYKKYRDEYEIVLVSEEIEKSKPATLVFLAKHGCLIDKIEFYPLHKSHLAWDKSDVFVTAQEEIIKHKKNNKTIIKSNYGG